MSTLSHALHAVDRRRAGVAEVAPTIVTRCAAGAEHVVEQPPDELQGDVLERQRRAVEQLEQPQCWSPICTSGTTAGWRNVPYASRHIAARVAGASRRRRTAPSPAAARSRRRRRAGEAVAAAPATSRDVQPAVAGQSGEQHVGEAERRAPCRGSRRTLTARSRAPSAADHAQQAADAAHRRRARAARARSPARRTRAPRG